MEILLPLTSTDAIILPEDFVTLILWVAGMVLIALLSYWLQERPFQLNKRTLTWFATLSLLVLVLTPLIELLPKLSQPNPPGGVPIYHLLIFAAAPFMVASGVLGPLAGTFLAGLTGFWLAYLDTRNLFTPLVLMSAALVFSWAVRQRFQERFFRWLRFPLLAALFSLTLIAPLVLFTSALSVAGTAAQRAAWAAESFPAVMTALAGMLMIGGLICTLLRALSKGSWHQDDPKKGQALGLMVRLCVFIILSFVIVLTVAFLTLWQVNLAFAQDVLGLLLPELYETIWKLTSRGLVIVASGLALTALVAWLALIPLDGGPVPTSSALGALSEGDIAGWERFLKSKGLNKAVRALMQHQQHREEVRQKLLDLSAQLAVPMNLIDTLQLVMGAGLGFGAVSVRVILTAAGVEMVGAPKNVFGLGQYANRLASFDPAVFTLVQDGEPLVLRRPELIETLPGTEGIPGLGAVIIVPIKWKNLRLGVFWAAQTADEVLDADQRGVYQSLARMTGQALVNAKTHQDAQARHTRFVEAFKLLPEALLILDERENILFVNQKALQIFELEPGDLDGKPFAGLLAADQDLPLSIPVRAPGIESEVRLANGRTLYLVTHPIKAKTVELGQVITLNEHSQMELVEPKGAEYVTFVSHELRTPLSLILGYAKILRLTGNLNDQQKTYTANIIDGLEDMKSLVGKLLDVDRIESEALLDLQPLSTQDLVRRAVESLDAQARQKHIKVKVDLEGAPETVIADGFYINLALKNYLENAQKFSKMGDEVHLRVHLAEDEVVFSVEDTGIGIAPLDQKRLFNKFGRANLQTEVAQEGSGLGLAIVKSVVEQHGGRVWLESQLGKGSTFYFSIPQQKS